MLTYKALSHIVHMSGYWGDHVENHSFKISPDVYPLSFEEASQLNSIGSMLPRMLENFDTLLQGRDINDRLNAVINTGTPRLFRQVQRIRPEIPQMIKVDLIQDTNNHFWITEIDSENIIERHLFCRFTAYFTTDGLVDVRVVARADKKVHGAPDAVQLGVVLPK